MKSFIGVVALLALLLTSYQLFAQGTGLGTVTYGIVGVSQDKRVFVDQGGNLVLASGSAYQTALYWAPAGTTVEADFTQVGGAVPLLTGAAAGTFFGGMRTITGLPENGAVVALQSRAWAVGPGVTSYETAVLNGAAIGKGPIFDLKTAYYPDITPSIGAAAGWRGYVIGNLPTYSANAVGYYTVDAPAGWCFIANNLNYKDNLLQDVLKLPLGFEAWLFKLDASVQQYVDMIAYIDGMGWYSPSDPAPALHPGQGGIMLVLSNGVAAPARLTFVGEIPRRSCGLIYAGQNLWSPPLGGSMADTQPREGDTVFTYDMLNQQYRDPWSYIEGLGWLSASDPDINGPRIQPGECVVLMASASRNPCVIEGTPPALSSPLAALTLLNPVRSNSSFSFEFPSEAGKTYQIESTDTYPGTWNPRGTPVGGTGQTIQLTDPSASVSSRYYRLLVQ